MAYGVIKMSGTCTYVLMMSSATMISRAVARGCILCFVKLGGAKTNRFQVCSSCFCFSNVLLHIRYSF